MDVIASRQARKAGRDYQVLIEKPRRVGELEFACRWSAVDDAGTVVDSHEAHGEDSADALTYAVVGVGVCLGTEFTYAGEKYAGFPCYRQADGPGKPGSYFLSSAGERRVREGSFSTAGVEDTVRAMDVVASREAEMGGDEYQVLIEKPRRVSESEFVCRWVVVDRVGVVVESYRACEEDSAGALVCAVLSVSPCLGSRFTCDGEDGAGFPRYRSAVEPGVPGSWFLPFTEEL